MINPDVITGPGAAFVAGLVTSLHCVGMCGPLAVAFAPGPGDKVSIHATTTVYHLGRILSYTIIGAIAGGIMQMPMALLQVSPAHYLPWVLVAFFLVLGLGLENRFPRPKFISLAYFKVQGRLRQMPRLSKAGLLGMATPFLPCGPLYIVFGVAMMTGSALRGAEFLLAFALGTLPLIYLVHSQFVRLHARLGPVWMRRLQRGMALVMAGIVAWRLGTVGDLGGAVDWCCPW